MRTSLHSRTLSAYAPSFDTGYSKPYIITLVVEVCQVQSKRTVNCFLLTSNVIIQLSKSLQCLVCEMDVDEEARDRLKGEDNVGPGQLEILSAFSSMREVGLECSQTGFPADVKHCRKPVV